MRQGSWFYKPLWSYLVSPSVFLKMEQGLSFARTIPIPRISIKFKSISLPKMKSSWNPIRLFGENSLFGKNEITKK